MATALLPLSRRRPMTVLHPVTASLTVLELVAQPCLTRN
jgi:hypothetical protein